MPNWAIISLHCPLLLPVVKEWLNGWYWLVTSSFVHIATTHINSTVRVFQQISATRALPASGDRDEMTKLPFIFKCFMTVFAWNSSILQQAVHHPITIYNFQVIPQSALRMLWSYIFNKIIYHHLSERATGIALMCSIFFCLWLGKYLHSCNTSHIALQEPIMGSCALPPGYWLLSEKRGN